MIISRDDMLPMKVVKIAPWINQELKIKAARENTTIQALLETAIIQFYKLKIPGNNKQ